MELLKIGETVLTFIVPYITEKSKKQSRLKSCKYFTVLWMGYCRFNICGVEVRELKEDGRVRNPVGLGNEICCHASTP